MLDERPVMEMDFMGGGRSWQTALNKPCDGAARLNSGGLLHMRMAPADRLTTALNLASTSPKKVANEDAAVDDPSAGRRGFSVVS